MPDRPTCKDCRFWDERGDLPGIGLCRRRAPEWATQRLPLEWATGLRVERAWPETDGAKDWCGEYDA